MPVTTATSVGDGLVLSTDGLVRKGTRLATSADVALRTDLPRGHPLYGTRALRCVPSGWGDVVIGDGGKPEPAIKPIEDPEKPLEEPTEVIR